VPTNGRHLPITSSGGCRPVVGTGADFVLNIDI